MLMNKLIVLNETAITAAKDKERIIQEIYSKITEK